MQLPDVSAVRFSVGRHATESEIDAAVKQLAAALSGTGPRR